jgi:adenine-specific DNA-methyltransferase
MENTLLEFAPLFQLDFDTPRSTGVFPATRYQGSKYKLLTWINHHTEHLEFQTVLDAFGGTGSVGYLFKKMGKDVIYNDYLAFNSHIGTALIENNHTRLSNEKVDYILGIHSHIEYKHFIFNNFHDIYFTDEENNWLDQIVQNIHSLEDKYEQSIAFFALFQACISKRPYNLFHRKNLYVRTAEVERSFGNKKTWDKPFETAFRKFVNEANFAVFNNHHTHKVYCEDILTLQCCIPDLVYIDPPYISNKGGGVDYFDFYHFLEGLVQYDNWEHLIDYNSKHLKLKARTNSWSDKKTIFAAFEQLFEKYKDSKLVISYRDDGIPTVAELIGLLNKIGKKVRVEHADYKYVFSKAQSKEVLIIAT